jgi:GNAT superfamily N-acetyltransferase
MMYREAVVADIPAIQSVRNAVKENRLSNPALVPDKDVELFITQRGKGWIGEVNGILAGFSIIDMQDNNVWALFVHPDFENKGIGKQLHGLMLQWYFSQTTKTLWLGTEPGTRAESFYRLNGWQQTGLHGKGEIKFEMDYTAFKTFNNQLAKK